jgi:urease accessory protein
MILAASVNHQRSVGSIVLSTGSTGLRRMREAGAAKVRLMPGSSEAILINTGGGLAGGDSFSVEITAEDGANLTVTTQAAERVYRSLGPPACIDVRLRAGSGATLNWLPQESILFDNSSLTRVIEADLAADARFLGVESVILGRQAMGERVHHASLKDRWRIRKGGRLFFADDLAFNGQPPLTNATLGDCRAFATLVLVAGDCDGLLDAVRDAMGDNGSCSAWSGKLVARLAARDGFELRKALIPALTLLAGTVPLPKVWSF